MKRIVSLLLAGVMMVSAVPVTYAADTQDHSLGTQVVFTAANNENYTITVPASLNPGQSGTVTLDGYWPDSKTVTVTAEKTVTLKNSIKAADTKTLNVTFLGISEAGSNTSKQTFTEPVSVEGISNALFGTWSGKFNYNVDTQSVPVLEGDGQTFYTTAPSTLSFRSTAPLSEFQEVKVNGVTVDPSNYTLTSGSTIVTLKIDYLKSLNVDSYQITVVSKSGSPSAGFTVMEPELNEHGFYYNQPYSAKSDGTSAVFLFYPNNTVQMYSCSSIGGVDENAVIGIMGTYSIEGNNVTMAFDGELFSGVMSADGTELDIDGLVLRLTDGSVVQYEDKLYYYHESLDGYVVISPNNTNTFDGFICTGLYNKPTVAIGFGGFSDCTSLTSMTIPSGVTTIGAGAFMGCTNLNEINLPEGVTSIGLAAFRGCTSLTNIIIPDSVTSLESKVFVDCNGLKSVTIGRGVTEIKQTTFQNCSSLINITFNGTVEQWNAISKVGLWNSDIPATEVICSNGTVALS